jgi:hypothetical protein
VPEHGGQGAPRARTGSELKRLIELDRGDRAYLVVRDGDDVQREIVLDPDATTTLGRGEACDVSLSWDATTSRLHSELVCRATSWLLLDDGLSANGTFVNGERVHGRRRLADGDLLRLGSTSLSFRDPTARQVIRTVAADDQITVAQITPMQRKVLVALCRPFADGARHAVPATNQQIAAELVLGTEAIKTHMRALFGRLGVEDLPQNVKRARVVEIALASGLVTPRDLRETEER